MVNSSREKKDKRSRLLLIIIISILFIINAGLIYNLINKDNELTIAKEELVDTRAERDNLEEIKAELDLALDSLQGRNERLDSVISSKEAVIREKVARIQQMIASGKVTRRQLEKAREEIAELRAFVTRYTAQIDSLSKENDYLKDENYTIKKDLDFERERAKNLEEENTDLSAKVAIGSRMDAENLVAAGVKDKWNGKEKETSRLNAADRIKVTFNLANNEIADKGNKKIYLKIITPSKATLSNEQAGSGTFNFKGEESLYTLSKDVNFQNKNEKVVFYWEKSNSMASGEYEAYLFCEDYIIGQTKFELK
jgi:cell division protein FtsB